MVEVQFTWKSSQKHKPKEKPEDWAWVNELKIIDIMGSLIKIFSKHRELPEMLVTFSSASSKK